MQTGLETLNTLAKGAWNFQGAMKESNWNSGQSLEGIEKLYLSEKSKRRGRDGEKGKADYHSELTGHQHLILIETQYRRKLLLEIAMSASWNISFACRTICLASWEVGSTIKVQIKGDSSPKSLFNTPWNSLHLPNRLNPQIIVIN